MDQVLWLLFIWKKLKINGGKAVKRKKIKKPKTLQTQQKAVIFTEYLVVLLLSQNRKLARKSALPDIFPPFFLSCYESNS